MGEVEDALVDPLEKGAPYLVEENGQDDRDGKAENQGVDVEEQGVFEYFEKVRRPEEPAELLEAHPLAPRDTQPDLEVLEGDNGAVHGYILKDQVIGQGQDQKNVKPPIPPDIFGKPGKVNSLVKTHRILL
jgi:hypothetical protein